MGEHILAGILLILVGFPLLFFAWAINKGNLDLISGYNTLSKEKRDKVDKEKLKSYVQRILFPLSLLVIEFGIIFLIKDDESIVYFILSALFGIPLIGLITYCISAKRPNKYIDLAHKIFTIISYLLLAILVVVFTFWI